MLAGERIRQVKASLSRDHELIYLAPQTGRDAGQSVQAGHGPDHETLANPVLPSIQCRPYVK